MNDEYQEINKVLNRKIKSFVRMFNCDTARIVRTRGTYFLIIGWKKNTKIERENGNDQGQWYKNGEPYDFDYTEEITIASGTTIEKLVKSAKHYKRVTKMKLSDYFRTELGASKDVVDALKSYGL